jgi:hypothetical protein
MPLRRALLAVLLSAAACGDASRDEPSNGAPPPPRGDPISRTEGAAIAGAEGWTWIPFPDARCTDALPSGFGSSTTGLAVSWGPEGSREVVLFLQGGGACWDFFTCGGAPELVPRTAVAGPFGPGEFADVYDTYPGSWLRRENLPPSLRDASLVFVPYCTGDVHGGDATTTYPSPLPGRAAVTWHHVGHANVKAFLKRLGPTFEDAEKVIVAGSSAGGFGSLANYVAVRAYWPDAKGYLVDDSGPPLVGDAVPAATRSAWYASWNLGASLDPFCAGCRTDLSQGLREILARFPDDRVALVSHLEDATIRGFFGRVTLLPSPGLVPMPADTFEAELRRLGTTVLDPATDHAKYFFPAGEGHPTLEDPAAVSTPLPGLEAWLELMLSDAPDWRSAADETDLGPALPGQRHQAHRMFESPP